MKNLSKFLLTICLLPILWSGCREANSNIYSDCIEGMIPNDTLYKIIYEECYKNSIWIEVLNRNDLGKNVEIYTPAPIGQTNLPITYNMVIETLIPNDLISMTDRIDTLLGAQVYFEYRLADEGEVMSLRNTACSDVYEALDIPVLIITQFSLESCPPSSDF